MFRPVSCDVPQLLYDDIYDYCASMPLNDLFDLYHAVTQCYDCFFGVSDALSLSLLRQYIDSWYEIICSVLTDRLYTALCCSQGHLAPGGGLGQAPRNPGGLVSPT